MTHSDWEKIKHFTIHEDWGDSDLMDFTLVQEMDRFREFTGIAMHVLCGTQGVHVKDSQHHNGRAVDVCFPKYKGTALDMLIAASRFRFAGIGLYGDWTLEGRPVVGLHLDMRDLSTASQKVSRAYWIGAKDEGGKTIYHILSESNLKKFKILS